VRHAVVIDLGDEVAVVRGARQQVRARLPALAQAAQIV
jgi:hypothetical protein